MTAVKALPALPFEHLYELFRERAQRFTGVSGTSTHDCKRERPVDETALAFTRHGGDK